MAKTVQRDKTKIKSFQILLLPHLTTAPVYLTLAQKVFSHRFIKHIYHVNRNKGTGRVGMLHFLSRRLLVQHAKKANSPVHRVPLF